MSIIANPTKSPIDSIKKPLTEDAAVFLLTVILANVGKLRSPILFINVRRVVGEKSYRCAPKVAVMLQ